MTAVRYGADAVECDLSFRTADGKFIVFHDPDLRRIADDPAVVSETSFKQISDILWEKAGYRPIVLDDLIEKYDARVPVLLDWTLHVRFSMRERKAVLTQISHVLCTGLITSVRNMLSQIRQSRLSSASMPMRWVTRWVASRSTGTS